MVFTYKVDGEWYGGTFHTNEAYRKNDAIAVRYDATKPEHNDLVDSEKRRKWITAAIVAAIAGVLIFVFLH